MQLATTATRHDPDKHAKHQGAQRMKRTSPYRMSGKRGKNDAADATAICEAVTRANMRFVPIKEKYQHP